jgi:hypothetical protein
MMITVRCLFVPTAMQDYTWMIVIHGIVAWLDAYGIGEIERGLRLAKAAEAASWERSCMYVSPTFISRCW